MIRVTDQLQREVVLSKAPQSIVSTVPSQTELLFYLSLHQCVKGVTWFCVHPKKMPAHVKKVGGTKNLDLQAIDRLQPDLIIANKEENDKEQIANLSAKYPVYISDVSDLDSALSMMTDIGVLTQTAEGCDELKSEIRRAFNHIPSFSGGRVLYLIWRAPYMAVGPGTYIDAQLNLLSLTNVVSANRYPEVSPEEISEIAPDYIFLSSEPYPFKQKHIEELQKLSPASKVVLVDGEMFSWYGNRMVKAAGYYRSLHAEMKA